MSCKLNGTRIARCVLDTGAAYTVIRYPDNAGKLIGHLVADQFTMVKSLIINSVEFGPLRVKAKRSDGLSEPEVYLGTTQLMSHCLTMDYGNRIARLSTQCHSDDGNFGYSPMTFSKGRPTILVPIGKKQYKFIIDTGSDSNWFFYQGQSPALLASGIVSAENLEAKCGLGDISVHRSLMLSDLKIGGRAQESLPFLLASENDFGGPTMTAEDGIIGTGQLAESHNGLQIIDFLAMRFYLR